MNKRRLAPIKETKFERIKEMQIGTRTLISGEIIKIAGEYGSRFRFDSLVTNKETGSQWVDCFELSKGVISGWRSFKSDRIRLMPIKRGKKNVD